MFLTHGICAQLEVVFFGDSITEDMHDSETVKQYYQPNYNTAAYGIGGALQPPVPRECSELLFDMSPRLVLAADVLSDRFARLSVPVLEIPPLFTQVTEHTTSSGGSKTCLSMI